VTGIAKLIWLPGISDEPAHGSYFGRHELGKKKECVQIEPYR
jgi:hypothetical protein